jgi:hypothetical protein
MPLPGLPPKIGLEPNLNRDGMVNYLLSKRYAP